MTAEPIIVIFFVEIESDDEYNNGRERYEAEGEQI